MTEDQLEQEALGWLGDVGHTHRYGPDLALDGSTPERVDYRHLFIHLGNDSAFRAVRQAVGR